MVPSKLSSSPRWLFLALLSVSVALGGVVLVGEHFVDPSDGESGQPSFTNVSHCRTISQPGYYALRSNVGGAAGLSDSCFRIKSSDVVLDGFGHAIDGRGVTNSTGIRIVNGSSVSNVTVRSFDLSDLNRGIHVKNGSHIQVRRVNASRNAEGVTFWNTTRSTVARSGFERNLVGVVVDNESARVRIANNNYFANNYAGDVARRRGRFRRADATQSTTAVGTVGPDERSPVRAPTSRYRAARRRADATR
ncbi:right-handed parallel beta-helix repeat-containing protein [Halomicrococcus gelatinilyticus]|uniref:right-handed parallel beta-helix repeat-containing protein n=1 Tax=Halomicrococcus gelatinilyticus TaxID=1702103 RepID=UPI002E13EF3B